MKVNNKNPDNKLISFVKMHSVGNDIIVIPTGVSLSADDTRALCHRKKGVGCDQVMVLSDPMSIWNQDGFLAEACGNGTRCVIEYLAPPIGKVVTLQGPVGPLKGWRNSDGTVSVCQGKAHVGLIKAEKGNVSVPFLSLEEYGSHIKGIPVDVGNPHLVIVLSQIPDLWLEWVPSLSQHALFPKGVNISFVAKSRDDTYDVCVWERGAGATGGCASAACAIGAALARDHEILLKMPGGAIAVTPSPDGWIHTAPVHVICQGHWYGN